MTWWCIAVATVWFYISGVEVITTARDYVILLGGWTVGLVVIV